MSKIITTGANKNLAVTAVMNPIGHKWTTDYRILDDSRDQVVLVNLQAPVGTEEVIKFGHSKVSDMNKNLSFDTSNLFPTKGTSLFVQIQGLAHVTDASASPAIDKQLPYQAHLIIKTANDADIANATFVQDTLIPRLLGCLYDNEGNTRITELYKGIDAPKGVL